jgi:predicted ATP-grasp superfamily ATP-dependent carboligase
VSAPSALHYHERARLERPILLLAYSGWSDGGDAATTAVRHLIRQLEPRRLAWIDTEDFLDFTVCRPQVRLRGGHREVAWPRHEFFCAELESGRDLILGAGVEPHLRWRHYANTVVELVQEARVELVLLLGAFLDDVIYSQPTQVYVYSPHPATARDFDTEPPVYEGPTGMLGVLGEALALADVPVVNLWARIPHYVSTRPNPRAALALLQHSEALGDLHFELGALEADAAKFDAAVAELIASDPDLAAYVRELKRRAFSQ